MKNKQLKTTTADKAMKKLALARIERKRRCASPALTSWLPCERKVVENMSRIEDVCKDTADKIYEMRRKCFSIKDIAKAIGRRDRFVAAVIDCNMWREVGVSQVRALRKEGLSIKAIAKKLKISDRTVSKVLSGGRKAGKA